MKTTILVLLLNFIVIFSYSRPLYTVEGNTVMVDIDGIGRKARMIRVDVLTKSAVKITTSNKEALSANKSLMLDQNMPLVKFKVDYKDNNVEIATTGVIVLVEESGLVRLFNRKGSRMIIESDKMFADSETESGAVSIKQRLFMAQENIFGLGQGDKDYRYSLRTKRTDIVQNDAALASPIFFSDKGYAMLWDNYSNTSFIDTRGYMEISSEVADEIQYVFISGPEWDQIVAELREISGKVPMLPRWAYGFWHTPSAFGMSDNAASIVSKYHELGLPADEYQTEFYNMYEKEMDIAKQPVAARYANAMIPYKLKTELDTLLARTDKRICIPTRSALPGMQKYGTFAYAGDITGCWPTLKNQVAAAMNISLSGQPYFSTNIGGMNYENCEKNPYNELLTRWYQFAAFNSVFQVSEPGRALWQIAKPGDGYYEGISNAIKLRYRLLPYIYSVAHLVSSKDYTMVRSLMFDFMDDPTAHHVDQQFMFGPSIMVCPVSEAGAKSKKVYLPGKEEKWYDFWTGESFDGGKEITVNVSIDKIPLFVRGGSVIPMGGLYSSANDSIGTPIELRVYPGAKKSFDLYEDQNEGFGYKTNQVMRINMNYDEKSKVLDIAGTEGSFPGAIVNRKFNLVLVGKGNGVGIAVSEPTHVVDYKNRRVRTKME